MCINWNPAGILGELDRQNMRLSYLGEPDAECRRIFYVVGRDEMADGAPRLEPFPRNRNFGFFDTMCCDNTDAFAFKPDWIVRFLGHECQKMFRCPVPSPESGYLFSERTADHHIDEVFRQLPELLGLSSKGLVSD